MKHRIFFIAIHFLYFRAIDVCPQIEILTYLKSRTKNARIRNEFFTIVNGLSKGTIHNIKHFTR